MRGPRFMQSVMAVSILFRYAMDIMSAKELCIKLHNILTELLLSLNVLFGIYTVLIKSNAHLTPVPLLPFGTLTTLLSHPILDHFKSNFF